MTVTLADQIAETKREIRQREHFYPRWISAGRITQEGSDRALARMRAVLATLEACQAGTPPTPDPKPVNPQGALL